MPKAVVNINETVKKELKSLPEGYVVLRRLSYGQYLVRREMATKLSFSGGGPKDTTGEINVANKLVTEYEFAHCIVEHNLENENEVLLDFKQPWAVHALDPRVGEEIGGYIDELNQFEAELGNSGNGSALQS